MRRRRIERPPVAPTAEATALRRPAPRCRRAVGARSTWLGCTTPRVFSRRMSIAAGGVCARPGSSPRAGERARAGEPLGCCLGGRHPGGPGLAHLLVQRAFELDQRPPLLIEHVDAAVRNARAGAAATPVRPYREEREAASAVGGVVPVEERLGEHHEPVARKGRHDPPRAFERLIEASCLGRALGDELGLKRAAEAEVGAVGIRQRLLADEVAEVGCPARLRRQGVQLGCDVQVILAGASRTGSAAHQPRQRAQRARTVGTRLGRADRARARAAPR